MKYTIQFIDIQGKIFYDEIQAQSRFMTVINSTISHEMRNPLNSIISQSYMHSLIYRQMSEWIENNKDSLD